MDVVVVQVHSNIPDEPLAKNRYYAARSMIDGSSSPAWEKGKTGCPRIKAVVKSEEEGIPVERYTIKTGVLDSTWYTHLTITHRRRNK